MSDNIAGIIVFLMMVGGVVALIVLCRLIASLFEKGTCPSKRELDDFEIDQQTNVADELYDKKTEEIRKATAGYGRYAGSPYFIE